MAAESSGKVLESALALRAGNVLFNQWVPNAELKKNARVLVRGDGVRVWDEKGREYLDGLSGFWCLPLGYGREDIVERMAEQLTELPFAPLDWRVHPPAVELAERLTALAPGDVSRVFFCSGGSEGVDWAIKAARAYWSQAGRPERDIIVYRKDAYHGSTLGATSVAGSAYLRDPYGPLIGATLETCQVDCCGCPPPAHTEACSDVCLKRVAETLDGAGADKIAAFIAEPVTAAGPVRVPPPGYWTKLQAMLSERGILLILDEVTTGIGRTGKWFAAEHWDIRPDMIVLAKGLSGGYAPLGAVLLSKKIAERLRNRVFSGYTFGGHPASCAAALATMDAMDRGFDTVSTLGRRLRTALMAATRKIPIAGDVRGIGLLASVDIDIEPGKWSLIAKECRDRGLICMVEDRALCLAPPFISSQKEIDRMARIAGEALKAAARDMS